MLQSWVLALAVAGFVILKPAAAQLAGTVERAKKISDSQGGRVPPLRDNDQLGRGVASIGDVDGDGIRDLVASVHGDDDGGLDQGAVFVFFLRADGLVRSTQKISALSGGLAGDLDPGDQFGRAVGALGDLDGDGVPDLAVGANFDDDGGMNRGAVWVLTLNRDGTVKRTSKISSTQGGFSGPIRNQDEFGRAVASPGDLDGDGIPELAVGSPTDNTGGTRRGAVWMLFLRQDGSVKRSVKIAHGMAGFTGRLRSLDWFGFSLAPLGDFDGDGVRDLAVGSALDDDGAVNAGAVWLLFLRTDGTVKRQQKISMLAGGFTAVLESPDQFGTSVAAIGDLDGDGVTELAVGAVKDGDGGTENGAVYVLFLTPTGTVAYHQKISDTQGAFPYNLDNWDWLGSSITPLQDFDGDGIAELAIGARNDDDGGSNRGAVYITYLKGSQALVAATSAATGLPSPPSLEPAELPLSRRGSFTAHGRFAEPEGSLQLVAGEPRPGSTLQLSLRVPASISASGGRGLLLLARERAEPGCAERTGILLEPRTVLPALCFSSEPARTEIELALTLPDSLAGENLSIQPLWLSPAGRELGDALELEID